MNFHLPSQAQYIYVVLDTHGVQDVELYASEYDHMLHNMQCVVLHIGVHYLFNRHLQQHRNCED